MNLLHVLKKLGPIPGAISGTATMCATAYDAFGHPGWRIGAWLATAGMLWWSTLVRESYQSQILDIKGEFTQLPTQWRQPSQWHPISLVLAIIATVVLVLDIAFATMRSPADVNYAEAFSLKVVGYTENSPGNILLEKKSRILAPLQRKRNTTRNHSAARDSIR